MPFPIRKVRDQMGEASAGTDLVAQDLSSLIPFMQQPFSLLQQMIFSEKDKAKIKNIWLSSEAKEDKSMIVSASIPQRDIDEMNSRGLIDILDRDDRHISLTEQGSKLLNESVLTTKSSFTKSASKKLVSKNSYDFGDEVLVKVNHPEKFGARYITLGKEKFADRKSVPQTIDDYNVSTTNEDGSIRNISEYTDEELIKVLHLSKRIINNGHHIAIAGNALSTVPVHRLKSFAEVILKELNAR